jgi:hypothetical protein
MIDNNTTARAMTMMIVAMLALPGIDAIAKWLAGSVSSGQVTWSRFFFQIILMSPLLLRTRGPWLTPALFLHAARGAMIAFATRCCRRCFSRKRSTGAEYRRSALASSAR